MGSKGGVPSKEFDRICTMMQITMTAGEHEALAALNKVNRILEREGLRWDEWLQSLKVVEKASSGNGSAKTSDGPYRGQSTWNYDRGQEYKKSSGFTWGRYKRKEEPPHPDALRKVDPPFYRFTSDTDSEFLEAVGVEWVKNIYEAAIAFGGLHKRSMEFIKDYWETRVRPNGRDCLVSKKQYDWLVNIQERLERMGAYR